MGCGASSPVVDHEAQARNAAIDKSLAADREKLKREIKLLFLGAGESGKSTILKQFQLAYGAPFTTEQREEYREVIFDNALRSMQVVIDAFDLLDIEAPPSLNEHIELIMSQGEDPELMAPGGELDGRIAEALSAVWAFEGAREAVDFSHEYQLNDSAPYYFSNIARLAQPGYLPSDQDILRSRVKSTGIVEVKLDIRGTPYRLCDVGGQRSERKKWINCFSDVQVLLFVLAISEFPQKLYEDESVSRIAEATTLWQSISNSRWFSKASVILFLNKTDLFRQKLELYKLSDYIPEYQGPNDWASTTAFLAHRFGEMYTNPNRALIVHLTCATDSSQIRTVLAAVQEQIIATNLLNAGML
ncbi:hypothetical protein JCM10213_007320 [Rhodosporidiobolus nylandii]